MAQTLVVVYGPPLAGKSSLARLLAEGLAGKSAVVSTDQLLSSVVAPDPDDGSHQAMVYLQTKLLVASYLKNGYNVVVEGPYARYRGGRVESHEKEMDQLIALMRMMRLRTALVRLRPDEAVLRARAAATGRGDDADAVVAVARAYREREEAIVIDSGSRATAAAAAEVLRQLGP